VHERQIARHELASPRDLNGPLGLQLTINSLLERYADIEHQNDPAGAIVALRALEIALATQ
jgi:hypothetical protein